MPTMKKTLKKYERPILLAVVVILLMTFSVTGAVQCGSQGPGGSLEMGGAFNVTPSERTDISDADFDRFFSRSQSFQYALRMPASREFRQQLMAHRPGNAHEEVWTELVTLAAAEEAGYRAGEYQTQKAVEDIVGFVLYMRAQLPFSDVNYQDFLRQNYTERPQADFEDAVADVVLRDQFLYPLITSARYTTSYPKAYEAWKSSRERVDLEYVSLDVAPFAAEVRSREETRAKVGTQQIILSNVAHAATQVRRVIATLEAARKDKGEYPESLALIKPEPDRWGTELSYEVIDDKPVVSSAGPDKAFGTADDVTLETKKQLQTHAALHELASQLGMRHKASKAWPESLEALKSATGDDQLPAATRIVKDGWEQDFVYDAGGEGTNATLASIGPDGEAGTDDDIRIALDPEAVRVPLGAALAAFRLAEPNDAWGKPLDIIVERGGPPAWSVVSAGPDGELGNDDDLKTSNAAELQQFFNSRSGDYRLPVRRRFETLLVHLPLVPDATLRKLWEQYPEHHPKSEKEIYEYWLSYKGKEFFYGADDPADPEKGHGAEVIKRVAPDATPTLVPARDIFPDLLKAPGDDGEPEKDDEEKKKDDEAKKDDGEEEDGDDEVETIDQENRRIFREKGWRRIVIRELFLENVLNALLKTARESQTAVKAAKVALAGFDAAHAEWTQAVKKWEAANAEKPEAERAPKPVEPKKAEVPAEITFESLLKDDLGAAVAAAGAATPAPVQHWVAPSLLTRKEWEANENFGSGLQFVLDGLKEDGQYYGIPVQLNRRITKVLVRRLAMKPEEQQTLDDVREDVFARFAEWRQMDRAAEALEKLREALVAAQEAIGADADDAAKQAARATALAEWGKDLGDSYLVESTGLYIGKPAPPAIVVTDEMTPERAAEVERRNFMWRAGYGTVERAPGAGDFVDAVPGSFGRSILRDHLVKDRDPEIVDGTPQPKDSGTGRAYLVRVKERVFPSKHEFSPRRYVEWLHGDVFGNLRSQRQRQPLAEMPGRINKAVAHWFSDFAWVKSKFKLETNSPLEIKKDKR